MQIQSWQADTAPSIERLNQEAQEEGFRFLAKALDQWETGIVRFNHPGEAFYLVMEDGEPIACGGVATDPYTLEPGVGRVRALYVSPRCRRKGIASRLLAHIEANTDFKRLRLRTPEAPAFYEANGYAPSAESRTTHTKTLNPS